MGLDIPGYATYNSDRLKSSLQGLLKDMNPSHILISQTAQGRDYAPGLAVRLGGVSIPGITRVVADQEACRFIRPVQGGRVDALIQAQGSPVVLTVQPGAFEPAPWPLPAQWSMTHSGDRSGDGQPQTDFTPPLPLDTDTSNRSLPGRTDKVCAETLDGNRKNGPRIQNLGIVSSIKSASTLAQAKIIVAGGRGIGNPEALEILRELVALFPSSALGASRPVIDAGWLPHGHQVGITGAVVSPDVYLALAISGSSQHLAGIRGAGVVVAVNTDPGAAIFNHADLCVVEDFKAFAHALKAEVNNHFTTG
jgi:electron transfer flavoprotein alpha subunit